MSRGVFFDIINYSQDSFRKLIFDTSTCCQVIVHMVNIQSPLLIEGHPLLLIEGHPPVVVGSSRTV